MPGDALLTDREVEAIDRAYESHCFVKGELPAAKQEVERLQLAAALRRQSGRAQQPRVVQVVRTVRVAAANPVTALVEHLARRAR